MKLVAWNSPQCPTDSTGAGCPSALWFWVALAIVGLAGLVKRGKRA